ncbi:hypothetical protein ACJX0J_021369, partial [Zea mays]
IVVELVVVLVAHQALIPSNHNLLHPLHFNEMGNIWNYAVHSLEELDSPFTEKEAPSKKEINELEDCAALTGQLQPFVKEEVLIYHNMLRSVIKSIFALHDTILVKGQEHFDLIRSKL